MYALCVSGAVNTQGLVWKFFYALYINCHSFIHSFIHRFVQNQPGFSLVLADCVRFWLKGSGPEASGCARIITAGEGRIKP